MAKRKPKNPAPAVDVHIVYTPLADLLAAPRNPKKHDAQTMDDSIERFGFNDPPTIDERTGRLLEGHGRIEALERRRAAGSKPPARVRLGGDGAWLVPIVRGVSFDDEREAEAYLLAHNKVGEGLWDSAGLAEMFKENPSMKGVGWSSEDVQRIIFAHSERAQSGADDDVVPDVPKVAVSKFGQLWQLGPHRLMCGDSTDAAMVKALMSGERAALIATDPPYGVAYGVKTGGDNYEPIANDESDGPKLQAFLTKIFRAAIAEAIRPNAAWYLWYAALMQRWLEGATLEVGLLFHRQIIWAKPSLVLGHGDFHWRHEPCFYGWLQGERAPWYGDRKQTTVWEIGRENDKIHPTQKPVEIFTRPMETNTKPGELCYEPFGGSGSQLIAAERTGRLSRTMELEPGYVDVIIERWQRVTGGKAKLLKGPR